MRHRRRESGGRALVLALAVLLVAAPIATGVAVQNTAAASGESDPVVEFAYVDTDTGNLTLVTASSDKIDLGVSATIVGAAKDMDDDYYVEVPYVQSNGGLYVIDRTGEGKQLTANAKTNPTGSSSATAKVSIGDLNGDETRAVFFANASTDQLQKVTYNGSPRTVGNGYSAQSVSGVGDVTGDGTLEIVFVQDGAFHYYNGSSVVGTGIKPNNPGEIAAPRDFNRDGIARLLYVDSSNNLQLAYVNGTKTSLTGNARKVPVTAVNWTGDRTLEAIYFTTTSANTVKYATLDGSKSGRILTTAKEVPGVAWVQDTDASLSVSTFSVTNESGTLRVSFDANEELQNATVDISGPAGVTLHLTEFNESVTDGTYTYVATYTPSADGTYNGTLQRAEASDGDVVTPDLTDDAVVDVRFTLSDLNVSARPDHDLAISFNASEKLSAVSITVSGPENATLDRSNVSTSDASAPYTYTGTYDGGSDGTYDVTLTNGTSRDGQEDTDDLTASVTVDQAFAAWNFTVTNASGDLRVSFTTGEQLGAANVTVDGPNDRTLHLADFTESQSNGGYRYVATYTPDADGTYNGTLQRAASGDGQVVTPDTTDGATIDLATPTVSAVSLAEATNPDGVVGPTDAVTVTASVSGDVGTVTADLSAFGAGTVTLTRQSGGTYAATVEVATDATDGTQAVTVSVTDGQGNTESRTTGPVTVDTTPPTVSVGADRTIAVGTSVTFSPASASDATTSVVTYRWSFGTGASETGRTVSHTYSSTGTYTVTLTVTDATGNTASTHLTVTVEAESTGGTTDTTDATDGTETTRQTTTRATTTASTTTTATTTTTRSTTTTIDTTTTTTQVGMETPRNAVQKKQQRSTATQTATTPVDSPGFGVTTALGALLGLALLDLRRREN